MKTYAIMNDVKYDDLEAAVAVAEEQGLEVEIDIYTDEGGYLRSVEVCKEDGYTYTRYCIWNPDKSDYATATEDYFDSFEEAEEVANSLSSGIYTIDEVLQDVSQYFETVQRTEIIVNND